MKMKIYAKHFFMPEELREPLCIEEKDGIITSIESKKCTDALNLEKFAVSAGFIDVHIHGFSGFDVSDGKTESLLEMSKRLPKTGTTAFLPTFVAMPFEKLKNALTEMTDAAKDAEGALPLGFHIEGVFVNPEKCGAMNPHYFIEPSLEKAEALKKAGNVRMFTVAPELKNAISVIKFLYENKISVSIGHSNASFRDAEKAFFSGASSITHFFNAMPHFHHRNTGVIGAGLVYPFYLQFIGDAVHTSAEVLKIMRFVKERLVLITDCTEAGGMPKGEYTLGDYKIFVDETSARLKDGTLAGSILTMEKGVKNLVRIGGFSIEEAIRAASENPAKSIGAKNIGKIKTGNLANFTVLDDDLNVVMTVVKGKVVYDAR